MEVVYLLQLSKVALTCNQHTGTEPSNRISSNITNSVKIELPIVWSVTTPLIITTRLNLQLAQH